MANELFVYELFKNILSASTVMEGRMFISKELANDANSTNFGQIITDAMDGLKIAKKYPCVIMKSPTDRTDPVVKNIGWHVMHFDMYFCCLAGRTGDGAIKGRDVQTNISRHTDAEDWKDMHECAWNFREKLRSITKSPPVCTYFRDHLHTNDFYHRYTHAGNDRVNYVHLIFDMQLYYGQCDFADYPSDEPITIPDLNPHPIHKH